MHSVLKQLLDSHEVPPALLLIAETSPDLLESVRSFAQVLMGAEHTDKIARGNHPDLHHYAPEGKSGIHSIAAIQQLIQEVHLPPFEAKAKVFILEQAHRMLPAAMNALLKTLEEPPPHTYFLLLTEESEALLPTIISRCRKIVLSSSLSESLPIDQQLLIDLLTSQNDELALLELLSKIEPKEADSEESTALYLKKCDLLFERILYWYRDLHLLAQKSDPKHLFYKSHLEALQKISSFPTLEKVLSKLTKSRQALRQHLKLRVILQHFFLEC